MAAPRGEVTIPIRRGKRGSGRLRPAANRPSAASLRLSCSNASCSAPTPLRLERLHLQLVFAAGFVDIDRAARQHRQAVLGLEFPVAVGGAERHALHLRFPLLQGEIVVAARGQLQAGDLARDPHVPKLRIERRADGRIQLADRIDAALGRQIEFERGLLHQAMVTRWVPGMMGGGF